MCIPPIGLLFCPSSSVVAATAPRVTLVRPGWIRESDRAVRERKSTLLQRADGVFQFGGNSWHVSYTMSIYRLALLFPWRRCLLLWQGQQEPVIISLMSAKKTYFGITPSDSPLVKRKNVRKVNSNMDRRHMEISPSRQSLRPIIFN